MKNYFYLTSSLSIVLLSLSACQMSPAPEKIVVTEALNQTSQTSDTNAIAPSMESRVETLEKQMKMVQPAIKKIDAIENHFKALSFELDKIAETYQMDEGAVATPMTAIPMAISSPSEQPSPVKKAEKPIEKSEIKKSAPSATEFSVTSVRIGEQGKDITRIVLDTTNPAEINYDLDNTEGLLVIEIPKAKWLTTKSQVFQKSPTIKSFQALEDEKGSRFVAELKQKSKVVATARLNPSGKSGHRVYIDISPVK
jgi:hypothetical protein